MAHDPDVNRADAPSAIVALRRLRQLLENRPAVGDLVAFHTAHKLLLLAHSPDAYRQLGRLVAAARPDTLEVQPQEYGRAFAAALCARSAICSRIHSS